MDYSTRTFALLVFSLILLSCESKEETALPEQAESELNLTNSWLAHDKLATTHFDMAQSDNFPMKVKKGTFNIDPLSEDVARVAVGPINIITLKSVEEDQWWGLSTAGITYIDGSEGQWREIDRYLLPNVVPLSENALDAVLSKSYNTPEELAKDYDAYWAPSKEENPTIRMLTGNSIYAVVDKDNYLYLTAAGNLLKFGLLEGKLELMAKIDVKSQMAIPDELQNHIDLSQIPGGITGVNMTYDGTLIVGTIFGLTAIDRDLKSIRSKIALPISSFFASFPPEKGDTPEFISNSFSIDPENAIYVASGSTMNKIIWTGTELSTDREKGAWTAAYDIGDYAPTIKYGKGTGSTPTLMGFGEGKDELVVLTNGENVMNLVAFWRAQKPEGQQMADKIQVRCGYEKLPDFIQSEQSVAVLDDGAFVVNNIAPSPEGLRDFDKVNKVGDLVYNVLAVGPIVGAGQGIERFSWDGERNKWKRVWAHKNVASTSMVPAISSSSKIVCVNTFDDEKGWQVLGFDWTTGERVHEVNFGKSSFGNGAYALIQYFDNGDLLFNGIGGPMRIELN